jgi:Ran GTPase-activating protein (RanGAP) involved in mRNA processing and transport
MHYSQQKKNNVMSSRLSETIASLHENRSVYLVNEEFGDVGAVAFADALKVNTTVKDIHLGGNEIGAEGAAALASALNVNKTVTKINFYMNEFGDVGAAAFADALKVNTTVTDIDLSCIHIGAEACPRAESEQVHHDDPSHI